MFSRCLVNIIFFSLAPYALFSFNSNNILSFKENRGQVSDQNFKIRPDVLFSGTDGNLVFHLRAEGLSYQLSKVVGWKTEKNESTKAINSSASEVSIHRLDINWINSNTNFKVKKDKALKDYENYYSQTAPNGATNIHSYQDVTILELYKGINTHFYSENGHLKYDYLVAPNTNYKQIKFEVLGADNISISKKGELIISTSIGTIIEETPLVFQRGKKLKAKWILQNNIVSFEIKDVDSSFPLIIDPLVRAWGTYYGDTGDDVAYSCSVDNSGNTYMVGHTQTTLSTVIATTGAHQTTIGSSRDAFVVKFDAAGTRLWGTYYGGAGDDQGKYCTNDAAGNIYMTGVTSTTTSGVIATLGSHQSVYGGGTYDAFIVKFDNSGLRLLGSYYGGTDIDYGYGITTDRSGNIILTGGTRSTSSISSVGAMQVSHGGGVDDGYIAKFNSLGVRLWATYCGGNLYDVVNSCSTDKNRNIYIGGTTEGTSSNVVSVTSHQNTNGGLYDAFVAKFDSNGVRQWGTYYGGNAYDYGYTCSSDLIGNVYLAGAASSSVGTTIATPGSLQPNYAGVGPATVNGFLVRFNTNGIRQWGTYYGSVSQDFVRSCKTDTLGRVYIAGQSSGSTGTAIATNPSYQSTIGGGALDGFVAKFDSIGQRLWGTYYGGNGNDFVMDCSHNNSGTIYITGGTSTNGGNAIATPGAHQVISSGVLYDCFLAKLIDCPTLPTLTVNAINPSICIGQSSTLSISGSASSFSWNPITTNTTIVVSPTVSTSYTAVASNTNGCYNQSAFMVTVTPTPTLTIASSKSVICVGQSAFLSASGATSGYTWSPISATVSLVSVSPTVTTTYTLFGVSAPGCSDTALYTLIVSPCTGLTEISNSEVPQIVPNPGSGEFILISPNVFENAAIEIFNGIGQLILTETLIEKETRLDLNSVSSGIYLVRISSKGAILFKEKLIKN